jgi:hypothetical protein
LMKQISSENLPIKEIDISRFEIREKKETLKDEEFVSLVESIKEIGVRVPIHIVNYKGSLEVLDGGRRLRAAKVAGLKTISTIEIQDARTELDIRRDAIVNNEIRKNLSMDELGEALLKYYGCAGFDVKKIQESATRLSARERHGAQNPSAKVENSFSTLSRDVGVQPWKQKEAIDWVLGTYEEIRKEAGTLTRLDKKQLVLKEVTDVEDKQIVKEVQKKIIADLKDAKNTTRAFKKARAKVALENAQEEIAERQKKPKKTMTAEQTAEAQEARRKDKLTPHKLMGQINGGLSKLWKGLTLQEYIPMVDSVIELRKLHIAPSHQFRKDLANAIPKQERVVLDNWLTFVKIAIEDMQDVLGKAERTAFDTRDKK